MNDQKSKAEPSETPEDVATLYSWANLHGAKYRDFSSSRAVAREEARLRAEEAATVERKRLEEEAERKAQEEAQIAARVAAEAAEAARQAEAERLAEIARQAEAERQAVLAAQEAQRQAALNRALQPPPGQDPDTYEPAFLSSSEPEFDRSSPEATSPIPAIDPAFIDVSQNAPPAPVRIDPIASNADQSAQTNNSAPPAPPLFSAHYPTQLRDPYQSRRGPFVDEPKPHLIASPVQAPTQQEYQAPQYQPTRYAASTYLPPQSQAYAPSPWQSEESRDQRENRDQRESLTRPAWLAPEFPTTPPPPQPVYPVQPAPPAATASSFSQANPAQEQRFVSAFNNPSPAVPVPSAYVPMVAQQPVYHGSSQSSSQAGSQFAPPPARMSGQNPNANPQPAAMPVEDTLQGSRDRIASRWYALNSVFDSQAAPVEPAPAAPPARVPAVAVFSLAGGVGKTSIVAALGRALSSRGERVLLVDTASFGLLPFFFGARDQRPGMLRTFNPPGVSAEAPIQLVTLDPDGQPPEIQNPETNQQQNQDWLTQEVTRQSRGSNRILIDLPTASGATTRRILKLSPVMLVPVIPDMNSVVSVGAIEAFFRNTNNAGGGQIMPYYLLNQFDYSLPLHLDVREILREQIGDRLLPFALRRSPAISEALAEGMTVMDYAPTATVAEDYATLAGWVRSLSAPASFSSRGVRWSER